LSFHLHFWRFFSLCRVLSSWNTSRMLVLYHLDCFVSDKMSVFVFIFVSLYKMSFYHYLYLRFFFSWLS
jgi:hypothetical protein